MIKAIIKKILFNGIVLFAVPVIVSVTSCYTGDGDLLDPSKGIDVQNNGGDSVTLDLPSDFTATYDTSTYDATFNWSYYYSSADGFQVQTDVYFDSTYSSSQLIAYYSGQIQYSATSSLSYGYIYPCRVRAVNSSPAYSEWVYTTVNTISLSATDYTSVYGYVYLSWEFYGSNVSYFIVERSSDGVNYYDISTYVSGNSYTDYSPATGINYYRIRAFLNSYVGSSIESSSSSAITCYASNGTATINTPANPSVYYDSANNYAALTWDYTYTNADSFLIERSDDGGVTYSNIGSLSYVSGTTSYSYNDTSVSSGITYYYRVRAYSTSYGVYSGYSDVVNCYTGVTSLDTPANTSVYYDSSNGYAALTWDYTYTNADSFLIERSSDGGATYSYIGTVSYSSGTTGYSYNDTSVSSGVTYYYRVRAYSTSYGVYSGYSDVVSCYVGTESYTYSSSIGSGYLSSPNRLCVDTSGYLYIPDFGNGVVFVFSSAGVYLNTIGSFSETTGVAVDSANSLVYVTSNYSTYLLQVFDTSGNTITYWGSGLSVPQDCAVDSSGSTTYIYVANTGSDQIVKYDTSGTVIANLGGTGTADGYFNYPSAVEVDSNGYLYVCDKNNNRIQKFDSSGNYITQWGSSGSGSGQFNEPQAIAIDGSNNVYIADSYNYRIQKFDSSGNYITEFSNSDGVSYYLNGVAVTSDGSTVYATAGNNGHVQVFTRSTK